MLVLLTTPSNLSRPNQDQVKQKYQKETDRNNKNKLNKNPSYKCIMANTSAIWQQAVHTTYHLQPVEHKPLKTTYS